MANQDSLLVCELLVNGTSPRAVPLNIRKVTETVTGEKHLVLLVQILSCILSVISLSAELCQISINHFYIHQ